MVQRVFHPVGQGAFYSEHHDNFTVVYDCGSTSKKLASKVVEQFFKQNDVIDILFISHFDYDHVSNIPQLIKLTKIKTVVLPLLHNHQKNLLTNIYRSLGKDILNLIDSPENFFGNNTKVIKVKPFNRNENNITSLEVNLNENGTQEIESGTILLNKFNQYSWIYVPYNHEYLTRNLMLEKLLTTNGFDVDKLKNDPRYTLSEIDSDLKTTKNIFKNIYKKLEGTININSMIVYSGTKPNTKLKLKTTSIYYKNKFINMYDYFKYFCNEKIGCIYTGDSDLNIVNNIPTIFKAYWNDVGTIQIPHHGSLKSFNKSILASQNYLCPMSVGNKNSHGHPSDKVIVDIINQKSIPLCVTEEKNTLLIQDIG